MNKYRLGSMEIDSIELKCLLVSRGAKVDKDIYRLFSPKHRLGISPLMCNCVLLSDGTIAQMIDMGFHLQYLMGALSWSNLKLLRYASQLGTPFTISLVENKAALLHNGEFVDWVSFPEKTDFYQRKTSSGLPFIGNTVIQGLDWVAFQCLWPCEFAAAGKPCEFCFSGAEFQTLARKGKPLPQAVKASDVAEIVKYAVDSVGCNSVQITGGSTFSAAKEAQHIKGYLQAINQDVGRHNLSGEILLYITPPQDTALIDEYFALGASRTACSLEVWDEERARVITPGKMQYTTRQRHLQVLEYVAKRHGPGRAFSNFIIGIESFETLRQGATYLVERGVIPTASIWMPMGRPVMNNMQAPDVEYYRRVKELFAELYQRYHLEPPGGCGLNVCMERDIWRYSCGAVPPPG